MMHIVDRISNINLVGARAFAMGCAVTALASTCPAQAGQSAPAASQIGSTAVVAAIPTMPNLTQRHHRDEDSGDPFGIQQRQRFPFYVSVGFFMPNFSDPGISNTSGGEFAFGYRMALDNADIKFSLRSQTFSLDDNFGNHTDATVSELGVDAVYRFTQFYAGGGVALGQVSGITDGFAFQGSNATVWSLIAGYDITPRIFVEGRWQTADVDAYKGYSVSVGYRF